MKSLLDDLGKWIAAISFALLVVSIVHDLAYYSVLGLGFQLIQPPMTILPMRANAHLKDAFRAKTKTLAQSVYEFYPCLGIP
jgi:hypothetical protein